MLERMVEKLVRIVSQLTTPMSLLAQRQECGFSNADWLSKTYAQGNKKVQAFTSAVQPGAVLDVHLPWLAICLPWPLMSSKAGTLMFSSLTRASSLLCYVHFTVLNVFEEFKVQEMLCVPS